MKEWLDGSTRLLPLSYHYANESENDISAEEKVAVICLNLIDVNMILNMAQVIKFDEGMVGWQHAPSLPLSLNESESDIPVQEKVKVTCFKLHQF